MAGLQSDRQARKRSAGQLNATDGIKPKRLKTQENGSRRIAQGAVGTEAGI